ncbi:hypothetical protein [Pararhodobacter zhoushanensis]|nr:hypothetical protein [Pararhodobacter zhoushanensis]
MTRTALLVVIAGLAVVAMVAAYMVYQDRQSGISIQIDGHGVSIDGH